jgi:hypothetical protein
MQGAGTNRTFLNRCDVPTRAQVFRIHDVPDGLGIVQIGSPRTAL